MIVIQLVPKPKTHFSYCSVCRLNYEDYLQVPTPITQHIKSETHKLSIRRSHFNKLILEHQKKYESNNVTRKSHAKNVENIETNIPIVLDDDSEILGNPSKKVKRDPPAEKINDEPLFNPYNQMPFQFPQAFIQQPIQFQIPPQFFPVNSTQFPPGTILPNNFGFLGQ